MGGSRRQRKEESSSGAAGESIRQGAKGNLAHTPLWRLNTALRHCEFNKDLREKSKIWQFDGYIITAARQRVQVRRRVCRGANGSNGWRNKQINSMQKSKTFAQTQRHKADTTHTQTEDTHTGIRHTQSLKHTHTHILLTHAHTQQPNTHTHAQGKFTMRN